MVGVLHNIRSMFNVGAIFRTADAAGISKLYLCGITPTPLDVFGKPRPQISKVALGSEKSVEWESARSTAAVIRKLHNEGYFVVALEQSLKSISYYNVKTRSKNIALVVGNEVKGLPQSILKLADAVAEIPMFGKKESLNVAVAFGVVAFDFARRQ